LTEEAPQLVSQERWQFIGNGANDSGQLGDSAYGSTLGSTKLNGKKCGDPGLGATAGKIRTIDERKMADVK
jgi:hypothetical protein